MDNKPYGLGYVPPGAVYIWGLNDTLDQVKIWNKLDHFKRNHNFQNQMGKNLLFDRDLIAAVQDNYFTRNTHLGQEELLIEYNEIQNELARRERERKEYDNILQQNIAYDQYLRHKYGEAYYNMWDDDFTEEEQEEKQSLSFMEHTFAVKLREIEDDSKLKKRAEKIEAMFYNP